MLSLLPYELILEISDHFDIFTILSTIMINKKYRNLFLTKKIRLMSNIRRIQTLYKNHLPRCPPLTTMSSISKSLLVRIYIAVYPMKYLLTYPEFLVTKINKLSNNIKNASLEKYVKGKIPTKDERTRRDIRNFLNHPLITSSDIVYTGW